MNLFDTENTLPFRVAIRKPLRASPSAKRDVDRVKEGRMTKAIARKRDRIRIDTAALAMGV